MTKEVEYNSEKIRLEVWDKKDICCGGPSIFNRAQCLIAVFSVDDEGTFESVKKYNVIC